MNIKSVFVKLLFALLLIPTVGLNQEIPVYEVGDNSTQLTHFSVGVITDSTALMTFEQIKQLPHKLVSSQFSIHSDKFNYWFILKLKNSGHESVNRLIGFDEVFMENADIYYETEEGVYSEESGLVVPIKERLIKNRCPLFNTTIKANDTLTVYLKLHSKFLNTLNIVVDDKVSHTLKEQKILILHWFYFGAAISIILYNLFLYFQIREKVYFYYVVYASCFVVLIYLYSGYSLYPIPSKIWHYKLHTFFAISLATTPIFTQLLLKTKNIARWLHNTLTAITVWYSILAVLILINLHYYNWLVVTGPPASLTVLFIAIVCFYKRTPLSGIYLLASGFYLIGLCITASGSLGLIPFDSLARHAFIYGSLFEFILLSLALGSRYKSLQEEKLNYQNKLITTEKEMTSRLEDKVEERTLELKMANEKLIELDEFKQGMTNMLVHDLKTPLSSILNVDIIPNEASRTEIIKHSGYKMMHLIQNILDVYKYESTDIVLNKTELYVCNIIKKALDEIQFLAELKFLHFSINCENNIVVNSDAEFIHRVLVNLLSNAVKFAPKQSTIKITTNCDKNKLQLSIHNSGAHIPTDKQQQIFEKYKQVEKVAQGNINSSGLGLTFCKMVVDAHKGEIGVTSEDGKGAEFWVVLPHAKISNISFADSQADAKAYVSLTLAEKQGLQSVYNLLAELSVYEITAFNKVFKIIEKEKLGNEKWITALEDAIYNNDDKRYKELIAIIIEE